MILEILENGSFSFNSTPSKPILCTLLQPQGFYFFSTIFSLDAHAVLEAGRGRGVLRRPEAGHKEGGAAEALGHQGPAGQAEARLDEAGMEIYGLKSKSIAVSTSKLAFDWLHKSEQPIRSQVSELTRLLT